MSILTDEERSALEGYAGCGCCQYTLDAEELWDRCPDGVHTQEAECTATATLGDLVDRILTARVKAAKAEALREAAEIITLRTNHVGCESCRINAEGETESWLRARADRIEEDQ